VPLAARLLIALWAVFDNEARKYTYRGNGAGMVRYRADLGGSKLPPARRMIIGGYRLSGTIPLFQRQGRG
jgi:hypothetical protein